MENKLQKVLISKKLLFYLIENTEDKWNNLELQEKGFMKLNSYRYFVIYKPFNIHT